MVERGKYYTSTTLQLLSNCSPRNVSSFCIISMRTVYLKVDLKIYIYSFDGIILCEENENSKSEGEETFWGWLYSLVFQEKNKRETQTLANLIGIYFDGCWSVQVPSYLILCSAGRLESIIASLWKPVKFVMKEGSRSDSGGKSSVVLTFFWQRLCRGNSVSHFH